MGDPFRMATLSKSPRSTRITLSEASSGPFDLSFRLFDTDSISVYVNGVKTTSYSLNVTFNDGYSDTAKITLLTAANAGTEIVIDSDLTPARDEDYINGPNLTAQLNVELARIWSAIADTKRDSQRSVRALDAIEPFPETASNRAGRLMRFSETGLAPEAGPTLAELLSDIPRIAVTTQKLYFTLDAATDTISGADENGVTLFYEAGLEAVYLNGVRLTPGSDYTQTNDSTITLASNGSVGDVVIVEVVRFIGGEISDFMLRSFDIAAAWDVDLTGAEDSAAGVRAARNNAVEVGVPVMFPAGTYLDGATPYVRTGPMFLLSNTDQALSFAPWRSPQRAMHIQWDTGDEAGGDTANPVYIQMRSFEGINADGVRVDHLSSGGVGTCFYARMATISTSGFGTALQGETRHEGGATTCANLESKTFSTTGNARGMIVKQATGSIQGWDVPHPITGKYPVAHPNPEGILVTGTVGATYAAGTPIEGQDDLSGDTVGAEGGWAVGLKFDESSMRANGTVIKIEPDVFTGIDILGTCAQAGIKMNANSIAFGVGDVVKMVYRDNGLIDFNYAGSTNLSLSTLGSNPAVFIGGKRVLSTRKSAISDVPTGVSATAADNATAINEILAVMRATGGHGLIENS